MRPAQSNGYECVSVRACVRVHEWGRTVNHFLSPGRAIIYIYLTRDQRASYGESAMQSKMQMATVRPMQAGLQPTQSLE